MNKIKSTLVNSVFLMFFFSCTSLNDEVKEYGAIKDDIETIYQDIANGTKNEEDGIAEISKLDEELETFDIEVIEQYFKEEEIRQEIERKNKEYKRQFKIDSTKQARLDQRKAHELKLLEEKKAREEEARQKAEEIERKREVAAMIAAEEQADRNAYIEELNEKGYFLVEFDAEYYEVNLKEWNDWKKSQDYDTAEAFTKYREMFDSMGYEKANKLANSMYRTVSKKIAMEGITYKAIEGIKVYDLLTTGDTKFD